MDPHQKIPGPDHPITVEPTGTRVVARVGDRVVADTTSALTLQEASYPPVQYVPLADVDPDVLRDSAMTTYCPYKGEAGYYTLVPADGAELVDAVWTYRTPYDAVAEIADHVAFYPDRVDVSVEA
jgi:uncharacterized protein (DUF427 family)